jgi:hypothetical protein
MTNFSGWDFVVETERWRGRWNGVIRIVSDEGVRLSLVRCRHYRDTEAEARQDAEALAREWSEKLERSPQSARKAAGRESTLDASAHRDLRPTVREEFALGA